MKTLLMVLTMTIILVILMWMLFYLLSFSGKWNKNEFSAFECGFSSYFFSRFSFSVHYLLIALIFLFLDLEICMVMPLFLETASESATIVSFMVILLILIASLLEEWRLGKLEWTF